MVIPKRIEQRFASILVGFYCSIFFGATILCVYQCHLHAVLLLLCKVCQLGRKNPARAPNNQKPWKKKSDHIWTVNYPKKYPNAFGLNSVNHFTIFYHLVMTNIAMASLIGKPSISMGHGLTMAMLNNQKVTQWFILHFNGQKSEDRLNDLPYQSLAAQDFPVDPDMVPISSPPRCPLLFFGTAAQQRLEHRTMSLSRQGLGSFKNGVYQINHHWMRKIWWFAPVALGGFHGFPTMFRNLVKWSW